MKEIKNVLISGGAGFIGSHLAEYLTLNNVDKVVVIDNLSLGRKANINQLFSKENFIFCEGDILNDIFLTRIFGQYSFDLVFHLAANSDIAKSHLNPEIDLSDTFLTTYHILNNMRIFNVKHIVFASSSAIYGDTDALISENHGPLCPISHYGAGKLASEAFISSFTENYGIKAWIARFPNVVGERATHGVIYDFINKLIKDKTILHVLGDGNQTKPYLYVQDLINALICIYNNSDKQINVFNIGVETDTKVSEIAQMVVEEMKLNPEIVYKGGPVGWIGDVPRFQYDLSKVYQIGWKANYTSNEAVRLSIRKILKEKKY